MRTALVTVIAATLSFAAPAQAYEPVVADGLDRAAAYWERAPACEHGVSVIEDQAIVGTNGALATTPGCTIWTGDIFARFDARTMCAHLVHEWGHLLGHSHAAYPDDPEVVMIYRSEFSLHEPTVCDGPPPGVSAVDMVAAAWAAEVAAKTPPPAPVPPPEPPAATPPPAPAATATPKPQGKAKACSRGHRQECRKAPRRKLRPARTRCFPVWHWRARCSRHGARAWSVRALDVRMASTTR